LRFDDDATTLQEGQEFAGLFTSHVDADAPGSLVFEAS
jgi:hypothetical protein